MSALQLATPPPTEIQPEPPTRSSRWWLLLGLLVLVASAAALSLVWRNRPRDPLEGLELVAARRGDIEDAVTSLGKIQARDYVDVGVQVSGQLEHIAVRVGDRVEQGTLLAKIDPRLQLAKLEMDRAQLAELEAERVAQKLQAELSIAEFERQTRMKKDGATREDTFERSRSEVRVAEAKLQAIDARVRQVRSTTKADEAQLSFTQIFAPIAGTVVSIDARAGQTLVATQQAPVLLRIADVASVTVWAQVAEADVSRLRIGMELYFTTLGHPGRKWSATLRQILPTPYKPPASASGTPATPAANNVVLYTALFDVDNAAEELRPEMSAIVHFVVARVTDAVVIPARALAASDAQSATAKVEVAMPDGTLETRTVRIGVRNRFDVQVLEGLAAGERIVQRAPPATETGAER
jgi:membrane fusion protein, macrolide-specific efflux system